MARQRGCAIAPALRRPVQEVADYFRAGERISPHAARATQMLLENGFSSVDHLEMRDAETLAPLPHNTGHPARAFATGSIRFA